MEWNEMGRDRKRSQGMGRGQSGKEGRKEGRQEGITGKGIKEGKGFRRAMQLKSEVIAFVFLRSRGLVDGYEGGEKVRS